MVNSGPTGAYPGFSKGRGEESARGAGFEPNAASDSERRVQQQGSGAQPPENFVLNNVLNQY